MVSENNPYDSEASTRAVVSSESKAHRRILFGIVVGVAANTMVVLACLELLRYPPGGPGGIVKPLFGNPYPALAVLLGLAIGLPLSISGMRRTDNSFRRLGLVGIVLACTPLPLCNFLIHWFSSLRGLMLEN